MKGWTKPEDRAFLELKGPDAVRFLNGQVANNVAVDLTSKVIAACLCTMKGKVEALVWITALDGAEGLLIETEERQAETVFNRLDRYLIADDCELSICEEPRDFLHIVSDSPVTENARECWRFGTRGFDVATDFDVGNLEKIDREALLIPSIRGGIPESGFEITGEEFPSELGLDQWAVDFHKGCYLGQEIVSRIESVGKTKKQLELFSTKQSFSKDELISDGAGRVVRDSIAISGGHFLTLVFGKGGYTKAGFKKIERQIPPRL